MTLPIDTTDDINFLFDDDRQPNWQKEWQDMPEFIQEDAWEYQKITVRFSSEKDVEDFAKLIGQTITPLTKDLWHPKTIGRCMNKRYADES